MASYVYSTAQGTLSNLYRMSFGQAGITRDPNAQIQAEGHLELDPSHMFKIQSTVVLPLSVHLGVQFTYVSGQRWARSSVTAVLNQGWLEYLIEPRGSQRMTNRTMLDLRLEKSFSFGAGVKAGIIIDVTNVFNSAYETSLVQYVSSSNYGKAYDIASPRYFRAGLRILF